ncbi:MAG: sulfatase-like hydrolase/transferase [Planctomycetaceae bacterium]|nr:sulfatase-like hydrolase/transferase [Planctomycetaceae bacterium]
MRVSSMLLVTALFAGQPISLTAADRPNIVYFMSDELGYYELSCLGNPNLKTPHIDRLASEGIRFTQCLAGSSVCAPTRCCLMTGKHSGHTSVRSNGGGTPMRAGEVTMASLLKDAGYATGGFGKWGCGGRGSTGVPEDHGFDVFLGYYDQVHAHSYYPPYLVRNSKEVPLADNHGRGDGQTYSHYVIFDAALDFIREHQGGPFFCYLPVTPPHGIFSIPDDDPAWKLYADQPWPEDARRYAAMVSMVDRNVGQVVDLLQELGLDDNTVFFFSGDNGGADYFKSDEHPRGVHGANVNPETAVEFRGRKGNFYEGGLRVPYIVRWPGKIKPGQVTDHLCYFPDALPTVCELTGIQPPSDIDGVSFASTLLGEAATGHPQQQHESLYWEMGNQTAVRMGNWKGVRSKPQAKWELYNLESDISESHDVAADHPEVVKQIARIAETSHTPVEEGTFHNREIHERDRQAKFGFDEPQAKGSDQPHFDLPAEGLISNRGWKLVEASSSARSKPARNAIDGDPTTWWHTEFTPQPVDPPHELVIDLGAEHTVRGFRCLPRQDKSWNGVIERCEFSVASRPDAFDAPVATARFAKSREIQSVDCPPTQGRYVRMRILSNVTGQAWASLAELGVVGE